MAVTDRLDEVQDLDTAPASSVKKLGWRQLMKRVASSGKLLVTNHNEREAVILTVSEYEAMLRLVHESQVQQEDALEVLRRRFDERLAALTTPDSGEKLRGVMQGPVKLEGRLKAGEKH